MRDEKGYLIYVECQTIEDTTSTQENEVALLQAIKYYIIVGYQQTILQMDSLIIFKVM